MSSRLQLFNNLPTGSGARKTFKEKLYAMTQHIEQDENNNASRVFMDEVIVTGCEYLRNQVEMTRILAEKMTKCKQDKESAEEFSKAAMAQLKISKEACDQVMKELSQSKDAREQFDEQLNNTIAKFNKEREHLDKQLKDTIAKADKQLNDTIAKFNKEREHLDKQLKDAIAEAKQERENCRKVREKADKNATDRFIAGSKSAYNETEADRRRYCEAYDEMKEALEQSEKKRTEFEKSIQQAEEGRRKAEMARRQAIKKVEDLEKDRANRRRRMIIADLTNELESTYFSNNGGQSFIDELKSERNTVACKLKCAIKLSTSTHQAELLEKPRHREIANHFKTIFNDATAYFKLRAVCMVRNSEAHLQILKDPKLTPLEQERAKLEQLVKIHDEFKDPLFKNLVMACQNLARTNIKQEEEKEEKEEAAQEPEA